MLTLNVQVFVSFCPAYRMLTLRLVLASLAFVRATRHAGGAITWTGDVEPSNPTLWTSTTTVNIGRDYSASLTVDGGSDLFLYYASIASFQTVGTVTVKGSGSSWSTTRLYIGSTGKGTLSILDNGLVNVSSRLYLDAPGDGNDSINMTGGGKLAVFGKRDDSLSHYLQFVRGFGLIRYWEQSSDSWASILDATLGSDYSLTYQQFGDLAGFTVLTVGGSDVVGDFDLSGDVDGSDFLEWQRGKSPNPLAANDLGDWKANFSGVASAGSNSLAVPEPQGCWLLCCVFLTSSAWIRSATRRRGIESRISAATAE
jgi:T5SS/PEP-CTERM-associated repeat protein